MPVTYLIGEDGSKLKVLQSAKDGFYVPTFHIPEFEQEFMSLPEWKARDSDILVSAYPKSGLYYIHCCDFYM